MDGAAPSEFTDHLGMPLFEAFSFVRQTLENFGLEKQIKVLAVEKIIAGFDLLKALSIGAYGKGNDVFAWLHTGSDLR